MKHLKKLMIWVCDDDKILLKTIARHLVLQKHEVKKFSDPNNIIDSLEPLSITNSPDLILLDLSIGESNGIHFIKKIKQISPQTEIVIISGTDTLNTVVKCMQEGAYNYIRKPFSNEELKACIDDISSKSPENTKANKLEEILSICVSPNFNELISKVQRIGGKSISILLSGESGTGKDLIAKYIHSQWAQDSNPFVDVNCPAIPEGLAESELFGHAKGSFSGADKDRIGKIEFSNSGTLFLDEIADLPPVIQNKLLRVLQERKIKRIGENISRDVEFQLISASSKSLTSPEFREDLYYRVAEIVIELPRLADRFEDILPLSNYFISSFCTQNDIELKKLSQSALDKLHSYSWPGNIRELNSVIKRSVLLCKTNILNKEDIMVDQRINTLKVQSVLTPIRQTEKELIIEKIKLTNGNISKSAKILGIGRTTLYRKIKQYEISLDKVIK